MKIIVCMKQVPAGNQVDIDPETGAMKRMSSEARTNPYDLFALETALALRERLGGTVTVLTMGPPQAEEMMRDAYTMGADDAVILSDRKFAGADVLATSYVLSQGVRLLGGADLIICGRQTTDGDTAQVGPEVAGQLDIPQLTNLVRFPEVSEGKVRAAKRAGNEVQLVEADLPCAIMVGRENCELDFPNLSGWRRAQERPVATWDENDLGLEAGQVGLAASPTQVVATDVPQRKMSR